MVQKEAGAERRPRGRPRSFDPDEVLDKARAVFWNLGYAATSLDDLAAATGLNRPSLYAAFGDKHALYLAALARSAKEATTALGAALATELPLRVVLQAIFDRTVEIYRRGEEGQRGCFLIGTAVTQAVDDPEARALLGAYVAETDRLFRERFERDRATLAAGVSPAGAGAMASGVFHTLAVRARTGAGEAELKAIGLAATDMICGPKP
ncbi:TetR/AcrR family transcriptional regulator [Phenylobacterium sp.]|uniref:TetR/AcrR family transcriptional regulator n=1 Tax=Phenylobacterium sp. TaxID=1871053 RepID=UPI002ED8E39C